MTAGCARCGNCCENIVCDTYDEALKWTSAALTGVPDPGTEDGWAYWREHGWDDGSREKAIRRYGAGSRADADFLAKYWHSPDGGAHYECSMFNPATRECTAHDRRPPVCRNYPWYREEPSAERAMQIGLQCSYLADLSPADRPEGARPLIPLLVLS